MPQLQTLIIDNYDSFTFNLAQYIGELGGGPIVKRNDEITIKDIQKIAPTHIIISPGPGRPDDPDYFGICSVVIRELSKTVPVLGVCLGMQGIYHAFGGRIIRAPAAMHGKTSCVSHDRQGIFRGLRSPLSAMRYHSLIADRASMPAELQITATDEQDGLVMAVQHVERPLFGIQFHPESIGTPQGLRILQNFLAS